MQLLRLHDGHANQAECDEVIYLMHTPTAVMLRLLGSVEDL